MIKWLQKTNRRRLRDTQAVPDAAGQDAIQLLRISQHNRRNDNNEEDEEREEVENGEANNASLAKLGLLERVDRRANLRARSMLR